MIKFYYHPSPNPAKVALFLEEAGLPYELVPVDTRKGEQHLPAFLAINPNGKTPAIVDGDVTVFDSNAILLYLAEKTGKFLPREHARAARRDVVLADVRRHRHRPLLGAGGALQAFRARAQGLRGQPLHCEAKRHWGILDAHLAGRRYMLGDTYTHRRHGGVGLGARRPVRPRRGGVGGDAQPEAPVRRDQRTPGRRSAPMRSRTATPSRPRWTRRPGGTCSRRTRAWPPPEAGRSAIQRRVEVGDQVLGSSIPTDRRSRSGGTGEAGPSMLARCSIRLSTPPSEVARFHSRPVPRSRSPPPRRRARGSTACRRTRPASAARPARGRGSRGSPG